jgi:26S proteasome regulatory subunit (ATPase 3-interacting protein)
MRKGTELAQMNRPYGAVDVAANLKGTVPKTAAQKILASLAERGELSQKTYGAQTSFSRSSYPTDSCPGKTIFFAPNQDKATALAPDALAASEKECADLEEVNKTLAAELKAAQTGAECAYIRLFLPPPPQSRPRRSDAATSA